MPSTPRTTSVQRPVSTPTDAAALLDVCAVLVTFNNAATIDDALDSILAQEPPISDVMVLDNASSDETVSVVESYISKNAQHPTRIQLGTSDTNLGFGAGVNLGVAKSTSTTRWVLLVNPDAELAKDTASALCDFAAANPQHGLYGGRCMEEDWVTVNPASCFGSMSLWSLVCYATGASTAFRNSERFDPESLGSWQRDSVREVGVISGALLLAERDLWNRLGGFDERFFLYAEDADLCERARDMGARPVIVPTARFCHPGGESSANKAAKVVMLQRGKAEYLLAHWSPLKAKAGIALLQAGTGLRTAVEQVRRLPESRRAWTAAWRQRADWRDGYVQARQRAQS